MWIRTETPSVGASGAELVVVYGAKADTDNPSYNEIWIASLANIPGFRDQLILNNWSPKYFGGPYWEVTVTYGTTGKGGGSEPLDNSTFSGDPSPPAVSTPTAPTDSDPLTSGYGFEIGGGSVHITQSLETISSTKRGGGVAPDFKQAIGRTKSGITGCEIFTPKMDWSRTVSRSIVDLPYLRTLNNCCGSTNNATFYGFAAGTLLYLGATLSYTQNSAWSVTHKFSYAENKINIDICAGLTVPNKGGWEFLWTSYADEIVGNEVAPLPDSAYVERVYGEANFEILEIGA